MSTPGATLISAFVTVMANSMFHFVLFAILAVCHGQDFDFESAPRPAPARVQPGYSGPAAPRPTPVAILKQINRHNEDGSYTYGYEGADGSFKIETKLPTGEVKGKYGYVDDTGKVRVVEYGATKHGFAPSGEGITVPPPTLVDETTDRNGNTLAEYSGGYYEDQQQQQIPTRTIQPRPRPAEQAQVFDFGPAPQAQPQQFAPRTRPQPQQLEYSPPQQFAPQPQQQFASQRGAAPVPPRAQIPGAAPSITNFEFGPPQRAPQRAAVQYARPVEEQYEPAPQPIRSAPRVTYAQPVQRAPQYAPAQSGPVRGGGGILDQLSKDYALPQGGAAPLHDISFGYY